MDMYWKDTGLSNAIVDPADRRVITSKGDGIIVTTEQAIAPKTGLHKFSVEVLSSTEPQDIYIGVAPVDIDVTNFRSWCGWYLHPASATLISGPPHNYSVTPMPLAAGEGHVKYPGNLFPGDVITLELDTNVGNLSFAINRKKLGVAYTGIPLDKPFVIASMLGKNDSIRVDPISATSPSLPPTGIHVIRTAQNEVTLAWDADTTVESTYYVTCEVAGGYADSAIAPIVYAGKTAECTVGGLIGGVEYDFFVSRRGAADTWSAPVRVAVPGKTFSDVKMLKNSVKGRDIIEIAENCMAATSRKAGSWHALLGDTLIFSGNDEDCEEGAKRSFKIKIVSLEGSSSDMFIGVAPVDVDPNLVESHPLHGWFLSTYRSNIVSGPPQNAQYLNYDPARAHIKTGDTVEVVCELDKKAKSVAVSFVVNDKPLGVAFGDVPLDKPIVPLVLMRNKGDSVELIPK